MQDTYVKIYKSASTYRAKGSLISWILTIVRNLSLNRIRDNKDYEPLSKHDASSSQDSSKSVEDRMILDLALKVLNQEERQIVILHAVTGLKHREIADMLDIPKGTVLSKYNRSLNKMKHALMEMGINNA